MKRILLLFLQIALPFLSASGEDEHGWVDYARRKIEETPENPSLEEIRRLAVFVGNESNEPDFLEVKKLAWERLQAVPDFADRFANYLREEREKFKSLKESASHYNRQRNRVISPMGKLPHPGVVRVLGEYLSDTERPGYDGGTWENRVAHAATPANAVLAAEALGQLIEKPPVQKPWNSYTEDDAKTWELWFAQVKAETRTYRFKGDPQDYNLQGPVSKIVEPTDLRPHRDEPEGSPATAPVEKTATFPIAALAAACGVLGAALWFLLKKGVRQAA